jgi:hypothetical protein
LLLAFKKAVGFAKDCRTRKTSNKNSWKVERNWRQSHGCRSKVKNIKHDCYHEKQFKMIIQLTLNKSQSPYSKFRLSRTVKFPSWSLHFKSA